MTVNPINPRYHKHLLPKSLLNHAVKKRFILVKKLYSVIGVPPNGKSLKTVRKKANITAAATTA